MGKNRFYSLARWVLCLGLLSLTLQCGGGGSSGGGGPSPSPPPSPGNLTSLSPVVAMQNGPQFTLTANGSSFPSGAQIVFNGTAEPTVVSSSTQLTATIPTSALSSAGTFNVSVVSGGVNSGTQNFYVVPAISAHTVSVTAGQATSGVNVSVSADTQSSPLLLQAIGASVGSQATSAGNTAVTVQPGTTVNLYAVGTGLKAGVFFEVTGNGDITVTQPLATDFSQTTDGTPSVNFNITVSSSAAAGPRSLIVTDPAGEISVFPGGIIVGSGS